jgi:Putative Actinobacterial Holin-X, holin superfamily III
VSDEPVEEKREAESVSELVEQFARDLAQLGLYQGQLEAARNVPDVRRALRDGAGALVAVAAILAAFAFANVAAYTGLATALAPWQAALVLAATWVVIGGLLVLAVARRVQESRLWTAIATSSPDAVAQLEESRDAAAQAARDTFGKLGPAISIEFVAAAVPSAGGLVETALDVSDEAVEAFVEDLPGGSAVNQIWSVALMPGRFGLRVATTILKRDATEDGGAASE